MEIVNDFPPNYYEIKQYFPEVETRIVFFPYGDVLYNPSGTEIPQDIGFHEKVHQEQQRSFTSPAVWWTRYLLDKQFRLSQELEACAGQCHWIRKNWGVKAGESGLEEMAANLSSSLYRLGISHNEAKSKIHKRAKDMLNLKQ